MKKFLLLFVIIILLFSACEETPETKTQEEVVKTKLTINNQSDVDLTNVNYASFSFGYTYENIFFKGSNLTREVGAGTRYIYFSLKINNVLINCRTELVTCEEGKDTTFIFTNNTPVTYTGNDQGYLLKNLFNTFSSFPGNLRVISVTDESINLAWNSVIGVNGYNIYRSTSQNGVYNKLNINLLTENVFTDTTVSSGTIYWYAVTSEINELETVKATAISATTFLPAPTDVQVTSFYDTAINISWNRVTGASSYNVYRATTKDGSYTKLNSSSITAANYSNSGLSANTSYYYYVCAVLSGIEGAKSSILSAKTLTAAPTGVTAVFQAPNSIKVSWNPVQGAVSYNVYIGGYLTGIGIIETSYIHTGLPDGTRHYYRITAINDVGESVKSSEISEITFPGIPTNLSIHSLTDDYNDIRLNWNSSGIMANSFNVYYAASIDGIKTKDGTSTSYSGSYKFINFPIATTYYFVTAVNKNGEGAYSEPLRILGPLPAPNNVTLTEPAGYIRFTWNAVPDAVSYKIYISNNILGSDITSGNQWSRATVKDTSYSMLSANLNTTRWYFITAVNADGIESALSAPVAYP